MTFENQNYKKLENHEINEQLFNDMIIELKLRNYSPKTIDTYLFQNIQFLKYCKKFPTQVQKNDIDNYLKQIILEKN